MSSIYKNINQEKIFSFLFISSLTSALFYTGNNTWLFSASFILLSFNLAAILVQRFYTPLNISINGIIISSLLLLGWFALSIIPSQIKYLTLYNFFWLGSLLIVFFLFSLSTNKNKIWKSVFPFILILVLVWAFYGLVQYYYLHVPSNASFLNRNSLAALIILALIPAAGYFLLNENERPWKILNNKILALILTVLFLTIFMITSRGASISLLLGLIILIHFAKKHISKPKIYALLTIVFIAFFIVILSQYFISNLPSGFTERMVSIQNTAQAGQPRYIIWESLIPLYKEMPWYGFGLGALWVFWPPFRHAADTSAGYFAHNDYIQITLEAGYPGIIILLTLFVFIVLSFIKSQKLTLSSVQKIELTSLFAALTTFAAHSFFTYNFYILPLLLIAGLYLARFNQLISLNQQTKTLPALKTYFSPLLYGISLLGILSILLVYFITTSLSSYYNIQAKKEMRQMHYQKSSRFFLQAQQLAPLMDNPFFSYADLLRHGAEQLLKVNKINQANSLLALAHENLNKAEQLHPFRPQTHHIRGLIYENKQPEKAKMEFKKALALNPRFLFARIRLAKLLYKEKNLKLALQVLHNGVDYTYPVSTIMFEYIKYYAQLSREAGNANFALSLEKNLEQLSKQKDK